MSGVSLLPPPRGGASLNPPRTDALDALAAWRESVAQWFAEHTPANWRQRMRGAPEEEYFEFQRWWLEEQREIGFAAPHWAKEWGGGGYSLAEQIIIAEEAARAGAPRLELFFHGLFHTYATLLAAGTQDQRERYLPRVLEGEMWCQGFSEPNAGSDLAALRTRARREGESYLINGQKVWSSQAAHADYCLLLARTGPEGSGRKGISYFILDMHTPGLEVRPIKQLTGESEFCELFLDDVEIPAENLIGAENEGWGIALGTLSTERSVTLLEMVERLRVTVRRDLTATIATATGLTAAPTDVRWQNLAELHAETEVLGLLSQRVMQDLLDGSGGGAVASILKLYYSELLQRVGNFGLQVSGLEAQLVQPLTHGIRFESGDWMYDYLSAWGWTIGGGTNEIQRNLIAERVLGLPREPKVGK